MAYISDRAERFVSVYELMKTAFDEETVLQFARNAVDEARREKWLVAGQMHEDWNRRAAMYYGDQKLNDNPWAQRPIENRAWRAVENQRYVLMDQRPMPEFLARDFAGDADDATVLSDMMRFITDVSNYKVAYASYVHNLLLYGTGIMKIFWDPDAFKGKGMVRFAAQDPRTFFVAPGSPTIKEAPYVMSVGMTDLDAALARFPEKKEEILSGLKSANTGDSSGGFFTSMFQRIQNTLVTTSSRRTQESEVSRDIEVLEIYAKIPSDPNLADIEGAKEVEHKIRIFTVINGKTVVRNEWLKFEHGEYPFVASQNRHFEGRIWGISDLKIIESLQQELDRMADKRSAYIELSYFPWIMNPINSGLQNDSFIQGPFPILRPNAGMVDAIRFLQPPPVGRHVQARREEIMREIDELTGTFVISSDVLQRNIQPTTVSQVREASEAPIRMKIKFMEPAFTDLAFQSVNLLQQFFPSDVIVRIIGDDEGPQDSHKISQSDLKKLKDINETKFDCRAVSPPQASLSRAQQFQQVMDALKNGIINPNTPLAIVEGLMTMLDLPNRRKALAELRLQDEVKQLNFELQKLQLATQIDQIQNPPPPQEQAGSTGMKSDDPAQVEAALGELPPEALNELLAAGQGVAPQA